MSMATNVVAFRTILTKELLRFSRIWVQTIFPPVVTMALYLMIFGKLIGERIGPVHGVPYQQYLIPGVVLMAVITNSYANVVSSFYSAKFHRNIEEMLISPIPNWVILSGYIAGGIGRGLAVGLAVGLASLFFAPIALTHIGTAILVLVLTSALFSLAGFINAIFAKSFDDISIIPTFVLTPLTYLGGIFYSIDMLPPFWHGVSLFNPILYMINAFRYGVLGVADISLNLAFSIILAFIAVLYLVALTLLNRGVGIKH